MFEELANKVSSAVGTTYAFAGAAGIILVWGAAGPLCGFSDTWQLVVNTSTTIVTFLMMFLLQRSQNKDSRALHVKIDELVRALPAANNKVIDLEHCAQAQINTIKQEIVDMAKDSEAIVQSTLEVTEASESKKKALAECKLPDKSLHELLAKQKEGAAHEDSTGNDGNGRDSGNK